MISDSLIKEYGNKSKELVNKRVEYKEEAKGKANSKKMRSLKERIMELDRWLKDVDSQVGHTTRPGGSYGK